VILINHINISISYHYTLIFHYRGVLLITYNPDNIYKYTR